MNDDAPPLTLEKHIAGPGAPGRPQHGAGLRYRRDIDGLRAVAVLSVVLFHAFPPLLPGGFIGVDIFFVISGFLISGILLGDLQRGDFSFTRFYARRVKRIFPALILVIAACLAFGWFALFPDEYKQLGKHVVGGAGFAANLFYWAQVGYFDTAAETKPLLHLWSPEHEAILKQLAREFPQVEWFQAAPALCDADWCYAMIDGRLMYRDRHHLSYDGDLRVGQRYAAWRRALREH